MAKPRKSGNRRDNHKAARALADWARDGFTRATATNIATTYGVAISTMWNWKKALETDTELVALFRDLLNEHLNRTWSDHLDEALTVSITRMLNLIRDSDNLPAVTEAFRALSEIALTREVLHGAANAQPGASLATQGRAGSAAGTAYN